MAKHLVEVTDGAGIKRTVRAVDAREIEAAAAKPVDTASAVYTEADAIAQNDGEDVAFPKDFPGATAFAAAGIGHHATLRMTRDELIAVDGIGEATADKILKLRGK